MPSGTVGHGKGLRALGDDAERPRRGRRSWQRCRRWADRRGGGCAFGAKGAEKAGPGLADIAWRARAAAARGPDVCLTVQGPTAPTDVTFAENGQGAAFLNKVRFRIGTGEGSNALAQPAA
jgi:hypothetical protein